MVKIVSLPGNLPVCGGIFIRGFHEEDVSMLRNLATDPYVAQTGSLPADADEREALGYIERQGERLRSGVGYPFCVALGSSDSAVGTVGLWMSEDEPAVARAGYSIAPRYRGHGYARSALLALMSFAATLPEILRVELYVEAWNVASVKTAEAAGFRCEGRQDHSRKAGGENVEMLLYGREC